MKKEIFDRAFLAARYPEFAEHFMQGDILILEDGTNRIIRFTNTYASIFRPKLSFAERLIDDFFPEYRRSRMELAGCLFLGVEVIINTSPPEEKQK